MSVRLIVLCVTSVEDRSRQCLEPGVTYVRESVNLQRPAAAAAAASSAAAAASHCRRLSAESASVPQQLTGAYLLTHYTLLIAAMSTMYSGLGFDHFDIITHTYLLPSDSSF